MSINSWKKEYYKGRVKTAARDAMAATEHSLLKWTGLSYDNLKKHGLEKWSCGIIANPQTRAEFSVGNDECALCQYSTYGDEYGISCKVCPLARSSDDMTCYDCDSPYRVWERTGDNAPMVQALQRTIAWLKEQ